MFRKKSRLFILVMSAEESREMDSRDETRRARKKAVSSRLETISSRHHPYSRLFSLSSLSLSSFLLSNQLRKQEEKRKRNEEEEKEDEDEDAIGIRDRGSALDGWTPSTTTTSSATSIPPSRPRPTFTHSS